MIMDFREGPFFDFYGNVLSHRATPVIMAMETPMALDLPVVNLHGLGKGHRDQATLLGQARWSIKKNILSP
jgi:hypothetical protein